MSATASRNRGSGMPPTKKPPTNKPKTKKPETKKPETKKPETKKPLRDTRTLRRVLAAVLMPVGPALIAVMRMWGPDQATAAEQIATTPGIQWAWGALGWIALFTLVPGVYAALHLTRRRGPVLTAWTAALLIPGYLGMTALIVLDATTWAAITEGYGPDKAAALADAAFNAPGAAVPVAVFVLGHVIGTVLLGILSIRTRLMPVWFGTAFALSQLVHFFATINGIRWLDLIGWGTTAVGMGLLGWHALHTTNDEWDLPPERV